MCCGLRLPSERSALASQVSGTTDACLAYRHLVVSEFPGVTPLFKEDPVAEPTFPRLRVKHKALVPDVAKGVDLEQRGEDVEPEQWAAMLGDTAQPKLLLDVRNEYEWDVGHFEGAARPQGIGHFSDSDAAAFGLPSDPKSKEETCALPQTIRTPCVTRMPLANTIAWAVAGR